MVCELEALELLPKVKSLLVWAGSDWLRLHQDPEPGMGQAPGRHRNPRPPKFKGPQTVGSAVALKEASVKSISKRYVANKIRRAWLN